MKKIFLIICLFFLSGCMLPKFHEDTQIIQLHYPKNTRMLVDGYKDNPEAIKVDRSFKSLNYVLSKDGFLDKKIEIKSHWTQDKWAKSKDCCAPWQDESAAYLLPFGSTVYFLTEPDIEEVLMFGIPLLVLGLSNDIVNLITLAWPRAVLGNPWYEYDKEIDLSKEILIPTPEFEHQCHARANMFIGNNDCVSCQANEVVTSTQEECSRCLNRSWNNNECLLLKTSVK